MTAEWTGHQAYELPSQNERWIAILHLHWNCAGKLLQGNGIEPDHALGWVM
jgi:hypothetical protein